MAGFVIAINIRSLTRRTNEQDYAQYRQPDLFQSFKIDSGNLVWGDDWDIIYPTWDLHDGRIW
ncbi:hypothetical protein AWR27_09140 [Spirosoma montaniterrae]|uniref:Uncharacterized protein n=1 Tax=Spirosoma montaniterrae TaxID=1178516 RepID=A0A1P9WVR8_9BACT|nr:hypothetical protein AWR27_09140 [Spirosoma montaniterrae]